MSNLEEKACEMVHDAMIHDDDYEAQAIRHAKNVITNARAGLGLSISLMVFWLVWPEAIGAHLTLMAATIWMLWSTHNEYKQMKRYAQMYRDVLDRKNVGRWDESGKDDGYLYWDYYVVIEREKKEPAGRDKK